jgi:HTH-type transcriptional regulator/antitoxin HigA
MHVLLHLHPGNERSVGTSEFFLDELLEEDKELSEIERHADEAAREALIPSELWQASAVRFAIAAPTVEQLAREVGVSPAIVAGRVRFETRNFRLLSAMVGTGEVRVHFPEI